MLCPNECSVGAVECDDLEDHIKVCLLQKMLCVLSPAGCEESFLCQDEDRHMEINSQKHLLTSATNENTSHKFEQKLQEQRAETERVKKELQEQRAKTERVKQELQE